MPGGRTLCAVQCASGFITEFCDFYGNALYCELSGLKDIVKVICNTTDVNYIEQYMGVRRMVGRSVQESTYIHTYIHTYVHTLLINLTKCPTHHNKQIKLTPQCVTINITISKQCNCKYHNKACSITPSNVACNKTKYIQTDRHTERQTCRQIDKQNIIVPSAIFFRMQLTTFSPELYQ